MVISFLLPFMLCRSTTLNRAISTRATCSYRSIHKPKCLHFISKLSFDVRKRKTYQQSVGSLSPYRSELLSKKNLLLLSYCKLSRTSKTLQLHWSRFNRLEFNWVSILGAFVASDASRGMRHTEWTGKRLQWAKFASEVEPDQIRQIGSPRTRLTFLETTLYCQFNGVL